MGNMSCNGICKKQSIKIHKKGSKYDMGLRYCCVCTVWLKNLVRCPCCNNKLRVKSRHKNNWLKHPDNKINSMVIN